MIEAVFPRAIDNTMRKDLVKCQKSAFWKYELGLRGRGEKKVDLVAGGAFAKGIEVARRTFYAEHFPVDKAMQAGVEAALAEYGDFQCPADSPKTADRVAGALMYYLYKFPLDKEEMRPLTFKDTGELAVELSFAYQINNTTIPEGFEYCGRFDALVMDPFGGVWVNDEKTTSSLGEKWANQWPLDAQMTGYVWGAQKILREHGMDNEVKGAIIGGVAIKKYDYDATRFKTYREDWEVERWYDQMREDIENWYSAHQTGSHNYNLDHSCAYYLKPCEYVQLCKSRNPERVYSGYDVIWWNPKERNE